MTRFNNTRRVTNKYRSLNERRCAFNCNRRRMKFESVPLTTFDCQYIDKLINKKLYNEFGYGADCTDDNADYGFLNIAIYNNSDKYVADYDIEVVNNSRINILYNDTVISTARTLEEAVNNIVKDFEDNIM